MRNKFISTEPTKENLLAKIEAYLKVHKSSRGLPYAEVTPEELDELDGIIS